MYKVRVLIGFLSISKSIKIKTTAKKSYRYSLQVYQFNVINRNK